MYVCMYLAMSFFVSLPALCNDMYITTNQPVGALNYVEQYHSILHYLHIDPHPHLSLRLRCFDLVNEE